MDSLARVPSTGRCTCGGVLWAVRPQRVRETLSFVCRRCRSRYGLAEPRWTPGMETDDARADGSQPR